MIDAEQFRIALTNAGVTLPLSAELETSTAIDADGDAVFVVDVERERDDADVSLILTAIVSAVNACAELPA